MAHIRRRSRRKHTRNTHDPYLSQAEKNKIAQEVKDYEHQEAEKARAAKRVITDAKIKATTHAELEADAHKPHHLSAGKKAEIKAKIDADIARDRAERAATRQHKRNGH